MEQTRKFKIIVNSKECGTCSGPTPSAVAKKVVKKLCGSSSKVVKFSLKECKRGCERVCGPYQGRMEKLDKPYKRDGKKITHRVVCGKVRKMRGGMYLKVEDFKKIFGEYATDYIRYGDYGLFKRPCIYFGNISITESKMGNGERIIQDISYFKYAIFNKQHLGKEIGISEIKEKSNQANQDYVEEVNIVRDLDKDLISELNNLYNDLKKKPSLYNSIRNFIKRKLQIQNNTESRNAQHQNNNVSKRFISNNHSIQESESTVAINNKHNASLIENSSVNQNNNSDLSMHYFEKREGGGEFKFDKIGLRPHIFFGKLINIERKEYYTLVVFNKELSGGNKKTCGFNKLNDVSRTIRVVSISKKKIKNNQESLIQLKKLLSLLVSYTYKNEYKTIRKELKELLDFNETYTNNSKKKNMNFCLFKFNINMLYSRYNFDCGDNYDMCGRMNKKLKRIIKQLNGIELSPGKKIFDEIKNLDDLFKRKDDYIIEHSYKLKKKFFQDTCYYTAICLSDSFVIFFSKNMNSDYYYLAFECNNIPYIAMYDPDNKMTTIYELYYNKNVIINLTFYYPSDMIDIVYCCIQCIENNKYKILKSESESESPNVKIEKIQQLDKFLDYFKK